MVWTVVSFVIVALAVSRATTMLTTDRIFLSFRRWVVNKYGDESMMSYWVHCRYCVSIWMALPAAPLWTALNLPLNKWWIAPFAWFALSYITVLLGRLEETD
jgi:sterol desaturase/sphingolipid hydroxylase (fatty acid hydroxylase superfamily)